MKKCKNDECDNNITDNRTYCSLHCRNVYVNKHLRDYTKISKTFIKKRTEKIDTYNDNPKHCLCCGKDLPYDKDSRKKFCNRSCSATYNNMHPVKMKRNYSEASLNNLRIVASRNFAHKGKKAGDLSVMAQEYSIHQNYCSVCGLPLEFKYRNRKFCGVSCRRVSDSNRMRTRNTYKSLCKFRFSISKYEFGSELIKKYGWYNASNHGNNLNGVSRDHMMSIDFGYSEMINPLLLAHPANCELMQHNDNSSKYKHCSITLAELLNRINEFDQKYGVYYAQQPKTYITAEELNELYLQASKK